MAFLFGLDSVHVEVPHKIIFDNVSLGVNEGDRIGIVGKNGDGKSTLLALFAGMREADSGRVLANTGLDMGYLGQADTLDSDETVAHEVVGDVPDYVWAKDARIRDILHGLIDDIPWDKKVGELSGGQRRRVDLARVLVKEHDVLLLDEPTNHLDVQTIAWLAAHLKNRWKKGQGALLVVTHDRWFLDEVCESMWEVHDGVVEPFEGGYSAYILQRVERDEMAARAEQKRRNIARKELAWLSRGARARSTKPKFHVKLAQELIAGEPPVRNSLELKQTALTRLGKQVIDLVHTTVAYDGAPVLSEVDWIIGPGDRIGILGANGAGKTTLLQVITGKLEPTGGRVKIGKTVKFASLSQNLDELAPFMDDRVKDVLAEYKNYYVIDGKGVSPAQLLESLGFEKGKLMTVVRDLSGGQRRRLQLMLTLLDKPNVLILDEPGNDLDTDMLAVMEDLLDSWPGTLILVTHDRYLMERVTDDQYALIDGKVYHMPGGVDQYLEMTAARESAGKAGLPLGVQASLDADQGAKGSSEKGVGTRESESAHAPKLSNIEQRALKKQLASTERKLATAQGKVDEAKEALLHVDPTDFEALVNQQKEIDALQETVDELELAWLELTERLGL